MIRDKIDNFHLLDMKNDIHPSIFFKHKDYDLFLLRLPQIQDNQVVYLSHVFIITDDKYYYYNKENDDFIDLINIKGFYKLLNQYINLTAKIISNNFHELETIEDTFYEGKSIQDFNQQWFTYKNNFIRVNRVLFKAVDIIEELIENYKHEDDFLERNFEDIQEHTQRAYRNSGLLLEKLDALYNFHITQNNEQMNKTVYILTLLSGIFLPLNLIVGFFGMNTTSLPFTVGNGGTFNVILLLTMFGLVSSFVIYLMKK